MKGAKNDTSVSDFYAGKSIFITGGSGFLGKVIIEKILYSCPLVEKIYVLLREKKSVSAEQRFENIIDQSVFSRIKSERPEALSKLILVRGELTASNLNVSPEDLQAIKDNVSIVIHCAATVKFNEHLKIAMAVNLEGTKNVLELTKNLKQVDAFVYVSTAYANADRSIVEEIIYPSPATIDEAYKLIEQGARPEDVTVYLNGWPNTYTYTKALAENLISENHDNIPTVIVRPSIVTGSLSEPTPGWVDNWCGPPGLITPIAMGVCRTLYTDYDNNLDIIPVDYACNLILVAATKAKRSRKTAVYHSCSGSTNPIKMGYSVKLFTDAAIKERFNVLPFPHFILCTKRKWLIKVIFKFMYFIACIADILFQFVRKKPRVGEILTKSEMVQDVLAFFSSKSWLIKSPKALALAKSLSPNDYQKFPCNAQDIIWEDYVPTYFRGIKTYLIEKQR